MKLGEEEGNPENQYGNVSLRVPKISENKSDASNILEFVER